MNYLILDLFQFVLNAQAKGADLPPQPSFAEVLVKMAPMFLIVFFIFYFMVIKPQQLKLTQQQSLLGSLKKGDQVVTSGGIIGRVFAVEEDCIVLDVSNNVRLKFERANIVKRKEAKGTETEKAA